MKTNKLILASLLVATLGFGLTPAAMADSGDGMGNHRTHRVGGFNGDDARVYRNYMDVYNQPNAVVVINQGDRVLIRDYMTAHYSSTCPERAGKDRPGCLPEGAAKRAYRRGDILTERVVYKPLPTEIYTRLTPVPAGYRYVVVDGDVLLISDDRRVYDTFSWVPAM